MADKQVDKHYARTADYRKDLEEIEAAGVCPFCPENFNWHPNPVLETHGDWLITEIREKYPNAERHFLLICKRHLTHVVEMLQQDWHDIDALLLFATAKYGLASKGGAITMRFGDTRYTGATVQHLHMHLIVPELNSRTGRAKTVKFPIG